MERACYDISESEITVLHSIILDFLRSTEEYADIVERQVRDYSEHFRKFVSHYSEAPVTPAFDKESEDYKKESARYIAEMRAFVADIERAKDGLDRAIGRRVAFEKTKRYWKWAWLLVGVLMTVLLQFFWPSLF